MRFFRWQRRCCSGKREKKPTTTSCYYLKTCVSVCYALKRNSRKQPLLESSRERERERGIRFGGWCAQKWYEKTRKKRERFSKRYFARRERERHKRTGEEDLFVWERKESFGAKKWFHVKKFFSHRSIFVNFWQIFWFFVLVWTFFNSAPLENGLIERETITLEYQQLWPKERNRREKPRNRYDQTESFSRVKMRRALTFCCPSFLRAFKRVYIYIYISDV